jgi:phosphatidylserine decarboxylase
MNDGLAISLLSVVPRRTASRIQGILSRLGVSKAVHQAVIRWYVGYYGVDTSEMEGSPGDYPTLAEFFTRALRADARPVDADPDAVVSPADARASSFGRVADGKLPLNAGMDLDIQRLVGGDPTWNKGHYAVLYLSPRDYHRVHHAVGGQIVGYRYLPGHLWPVFPAAVRRIRDLFAVNERLVVETRDQQLGRVATILVGAYGVGRMTTSFCDLVTNAGQGAHSRTLDPAIPVQAGDELGRFNMGSTVVMLFEPGKVAWELERDTMVRVGQRIARRLP